MNQKNKIKFHVYHCNILVTIEIDTLFKMFVQDEFSNFEVSGFVGKFVATLFQQSVSCQSQIGFQVFMMINMFYTFLMKL